MSSLQLLRDNKGIALLYLVIFFTLLGVLISFSARKYGASVTQGKINEAKVGLERDVQMIVAWSVKNGRLPTSAEYPGVFGTTPLDAWGKPVVYSYDNNMITLAGGGLCGRTGTAISYTGQNVAFLLVSGGDDMNVTSAPGASGAFSGTLTGLSNEDMYRIVTLKELQELAHCFGTTQGTLRILNNELPKACIGNSYSATLFADGGVPPVSFSFTGLPAGITNAGAILAGTTTVPKGAYPVVVTATDSQSPPTPPLQRKYFMNVTSCN